MPELSSIFCSKSLMWKLGLLFLVAVILFAGGSWITYERKPLPEAIQALKSDDLVAVTLEPWLIFSPTQTTPDTGFIFYPGGRIDPQGYAPLLKAIASQGYMVVVPEMPLNIAAFRPNIADEIMAYYPTIRQWVIGGHSVGGTMAAQYTFTHKNMIAGLVIWASYPADNVDLSNSDLPIALIYGSLDPVVNDSSVLERQHLLPKDAHYVRIEGGDHHQFGSYVISPEDHHAIIEREAQQEQIIQATLAVLQEARQGL